METTKIGNTLSPKCGLTSSEPFEVYLVAPDPPVSVLHGTVGTILVVQHPDPLRAACVTTAFPAEGQLAHKIELAHSLELRTPYDQVLSAGRVPDTCLRGDILMLPDDVWLGLVAMNYLLVTPSVFLMALVSSLDIRELRTWNTGLIHF